MLMVQLHRIFYFLNLHRLLHSKKQLSNFLVVKDSVVIKLSYQSDFPFLCIWWYCYDMLSSFLHLSYFLCNLNFLSDAAYKNGSTYKGQLSLSLCDAIPVPKMTFLNSVLEFYWKSSCNSSFQPHTLIKKKSNLWKAKDGIFFLKIINYYSSFLNRPQWRLINWKKYCLKICEYQCDRHSFPLPFIQVNTILTVCAELIHM